MRNRTILIACAALAGCAQPPAATTPLAAKPASAPGSFAPPGFHVTNAAAGLDTVIRVWAWGATRSAAGRDIHFSVEATDDPLVGTTGTFFVVDTAIDTTYMGSITGGHFTHDARGSGTAPMTGFLARGTPASLTLVDANRADAVDNFALQVPGLIDFQGGVIHGDIRVALAVRPPKAEPSGFAPPPGFAFDPEIGLFVADADTGDRHVLGPQDPIPDAVLQTVRPEPVIDFQRNRLGGTLTTAGDVDNTLDAIPGTRPMIKNLTDYVLAH